LISFHKGPHTASTAANEANDKWNNNGGDISSGTSSSGGPSKLQSK